MPNSLRRKIAQLLILGFDGTRLPDNLTFSAFLAEYGVGGVVLFKESVAHPKICKNLVDPDQIRELTRTVHETAMKACGMAPLVCIDYEGGRVDRLSDVPGMLQTPSAEAMAHMSPEKFDWNVHQMAQTLDDLGFNLNFAPVVDLGLSSDKGIIAPLQRSFGRDAQTVSGLAMRFVRIFQEYHIASCFKHFPGHGSATGDTHSDIVDASACFNPSELEPYRRLSQAHDLPVTVMTAHIINRQLDPAGLPATLSELMIQKVLRQEMRFDGVVISDDLQMQAISQQYSMPEALIGAICAGCDMLIIANQFDSHDPLYLIDCIENACHKGSVSETQIDAALARVLHLKSAITGSKLGQQRRVSL